MSVSLASVTVYGHEAHTHQIIQMPTKIKAFPSGSRLRALASLPCPPNRLRNTRMPPTQWARPVPAFSDPLPRLEVEDRPECYSTMAERIFLRGMGGGGGGVGGAGGGGWSLRVMSFN